MTKQEIIDIIKRNGKDGVSDCEKYMDIQTKIQFGGLEVVQISYFGDKDELMVYCMDSYNNGVWCDYDGLPDTVIEQIANLQEIKKFNVRIKRIVEWIHPYFGNRHTMPYGTLEVTDGTETKMCRTKGDTIESYEKYGCQCIIFNRKRYEVKMTKDCKRLYLEPMF